MMIQQKVIPVKEFKNKILITSSGDFCFKDVSTQKGLIYDYSVFQMRYLRTHLKGQRKTMFFNRLLAISFRDLYEII